MDNPFLVILMRWAHVIGAALAIGGLVVMRFALPAGLKAIQDEALRDEVFLRVRRVFKMIVHTAILLILVGGIYNTIRLWPGYKGLHGLWGTHVLFGLIAIGIALWLTMGPRPPAEHRTFALLNVVVLLAIVALGSTVKWARERKANREQGTTPAAATMQPARPG
jgi:hypothetical protein